MVWSPIVVLTLLVCFSYESIKSVCDRYNKAIDSFRQLVSYTHSSTTSSFSDFEFDMMSANSGVILCTVHQRLSQIVKHCTLHPVKQQITVSVKGSSNGRTMVYQHSLSIDLVQLWTAVLTNRSKFFLLHSMHGDRRLIKMFAYSP